MTPQLRIAALGIGPFVTDAAALMAEAEAGIRILSAGGADLVVLPELFALPFYAGDDPQRWQAAAETLEGATCAWAKRVSSDTGTAIVFGMALASPNGERPVNASMFAAPGVPPRVVQKKVHLAPAADEPFGETDHFTAGPASIDVFDYRGTRFCALVCYDRRFPESWRAAARQGTDVVLVLVGGPACDPPGLFAAELRTHARANAVYALASSRYGSETATGRRHTHEGGTLAADPDGALLPVGEHNVLLTIAPAFIDRARAHNPTHKKLRLGDQAYERLYA